MRTQHITAIEFGDKYRDEFTGIEGVATAVMFTQHSERTKIEYTINQEFKETWFDSERLILVPESITKQVGLGGMK